MGKKNSETISFEFTYNIYQALKHGFKVFLPYDSSSHKFVGKK